MKHCIEFEELISAYVDGELDSSEKPLVEEHLRACPGCLNLLALYHGMSVSLAESCIEAPGFLRDNVMGAIRNPSAAGIVTPVYPDEIDREYEARVKRRKLVRTILTRYAPVAACLAIALLVLPQFFNIDRTAYESPVATTAMPEMEAADTGYAMPFAVDLEIAEEELDDAQLVPSEPSALPDVAADEDSMLWGDDYDDQIGVRTPGGDADNVSTPTGGWTMNDSLLEPENVATAGYYAFIMIEHEFSDYFTLISVYGDYHLLEQSDVARFIERYEDFIAFFIPGDDTAEFALIQFVL
jgi:hypothetical protein